MGDYEDYSDDAYGYGFMRRMEREFGRNCDTARQKLGKFHNRR